MKYIDVSGPLDLMKMLEDGEMEVSGTKSYDDVNFLPKEACNPLETPESKFGGLKIKG